MIGSSHNRWDDKSFFVIYSTGFTSAAVEFYVFFTYDIGVPFGDGGEMVSFCFRLHGA